MEYKFSEIEKKWQENWKATNAYAVSNVSDKPKCYVLDMFPYPSGAGLHVGHPLGYIASDIYSRYKRLKGFNVLHPMGFDSFGLPAEQYAIETGQHPAATTKENIQNFKNQLDKIGFCYDWDREVRTSDPGYYKWTQWIFLKLFNSYFCNTQQKARPISDLVEKYSTKGTKNFTAEEWNNYTEQQQADILMNRRLAYSTYGEVNWCEALGTVLANDEVINGFSERGNFPVVKKKMKQWYLRITSYADRLLEGLETVQFTDAMKEMQRNWIGKSEGAELSFEIENIEEKINVYTTRPDTIFGVDFLVLAPEHTLVNQITTTEQQQSIDEYLTYVKSRSDRERMAEVKQITGCFTGSYAKNPFDGRLVPIWIAEYVLAGYGTGAIMAVPCGDQRDFGFAQHFNIPITNIIGDAFNGEEANATKEATLQNSGFLDGMLMKDAIGVAIDKIENLGIGKRKKNYRMRDAGFSRQRYWGEPFPIQWKDGVAVPLSENELPLTLPHVEKYGPGPEGEGPLANIPEWKAANYETSTMPGYAGSSWYFLRYMDPKNESIFCSRAASDYWNQVDVYIGGTEHAVGHLLYSRLWTKVLYDLGFIGFDEPFKKLVNQGMITGKSYFFMLEKERDGKIISYLKNEGTEHFLRFKYGHNYVDVNGRLTKKLFEKYLQDHGQDAADFNIEWQEEKGEAFIMTKEESEKMSKSKFNVDNPDDLIYKYGADTFRMYEMFLGPVEMSKPWDTKGIEGVHRFLRKLWRLFNDDIKGRIWNADKAADAAMKVLHKAIKKIDQDTENFSYNTAVSAFMIAVNELSDLKCHNKEVLEKILVLIAPYAPHIAEELWNQLGNEDSVLDATYPVFDAKYLVEDSKDYPISVNGKLRTSITISMSATEEEVKGIVLSNEVIEKWLEGKEAKKVIFVKGKMVNVVV